MSFDSFLHDHQYPNCRVALNVTLMKLNIQYRFVVKTTYKMFKQTGYLAVLIIPDRTPEGESEFAWATAKTVKEAKELTAMRALQYIEAGLLGKAHYPSIHGPQIHPI